MNPHVACQQSSSNARKVVGQCSDGNMVVRDTNFSQDVSVKVVAVNNFEVGVGSSG